MVKLYTGLGFIQISNEVLTYMTGEAATNCFGVKGMTVRSMTDGIVHLLKKEYMGKGVKVSYNPNGTIALELHIAVDHGVNLPVLCGNIISEVRYKIETAAGVKVENIDVFVDSIIAG